MYSHKMEAVKWRKIMKKARNMNNLLTKRIIKTYLSSNKKQQKTNQSSQKAKLTILSLNVSS